MIGQLAELPASDVAALIAMLTEPRAAGPRPWTLASAQHGVVRGHLVPANLTLASVLVATPWQLPLAGAIALFEDVGERPYEVDRRLTHMMLTAQLPVLHGAILGDLGRCADPAPAKRRVTPRSPWSASAASPRACRSRSARRSGMASATSRFRSAPACTLDLDAGVLEIAEAAVAEFPDRSLVTAPAAIGDGSRRGAITKPRSD